LLHEGQLVGGDLQFELELAQALARRLSVRERFHWLVAPSSTIIQPSAVHTGMTEDPAAQLNHLFDSMVG